MAHMNVHVYLYISGLAVLALLNIYAAYLHNIIIYTYPGGVCADIMYTYEDFRCLHGFHSGEDNWDCSHYQAELVHYLNWKLLHAVDRISRRRARAWGGGGSSKSKRRGGRLHSSSRGGGGGAAEQHRMSEATQPATTLLNQLTT